MNEIGDRGAQCLAAALRLNTVRILSSRFVLLQHLNLSFAQTLISLYLSNNHIGDKGAEHLGNALRQNQVRHHVYILGLIDTLGELLSYRH